jgi:hypothetical protein
MQNYSDAEMRQILKYPHLLGHLAGKDKLTKMHSEWINYVWYPKEHRSLAAHRGSFKTTAITELGTIIALAKNPDARIAIVKKTYTNAAESVRNIANIMMMPDIYAFLEDFWGKWKFITLKDGKFTLSVKNTKTKEGSCEALGMDSSFTGRHYDNIMIDDTIDLDDRLSEAEREHTNVVTNELYSNIIDPGKHIGATGTFWHPKDAWTIMPTPKIFTVSDTGLLSPEQIAEKRRFTTPVLWQINYELSFLSEADMLFMNPKLGLWHGDKVKDVTAHLDAAFDGNHYCALTIMGRLPNKKFNAVGWVYPGNVKDWLPFIVKKMVEFKASTLHVETNPDRGYTADALRAFPDVQSNHIWIEDYDERTKKTEKIATYGYEVWKDTEWGESATDKNYLEQMVDYLPDQEPDDAPDSFASLCRQANFSVTKAWESNVWDFN